MPKKLTSSQKVHRTAVKAAKRWVKKAKGGLKIKRGKRWK